MRNVLTVALIFTITGCLTWDNPNSSDFQNYRDENLKISFPIYKSWDTTIIDSNASILFKDAERRKMEFLVDKLTDVNYEAQKSALTASISTKYTITDSSTQSTTLGTGFSFQVSNSTDTTHVHYILWEDFKRSYLFTYKTEFPIDGYPAKLKSEIELLP